ncbi:hypothetical protein [Desulfovibrio sp. MES5]|uniref:hypothetical protein n=1 Tax=Desulfovibrio sp. MES5 TaxID=1899016 RepID=UPI0025BAAE13|nr:hypothetical protein [Desulfovibrio sp. MES5]
MKYFTVRFVILLKNTISSRIHVTLWRAALLSASGHLTFFKGKMRYFPYCHGQIIAAALRLAGDVFIVCAALAVIRQ